MPANSPKNKDNPLDAMLSLLKSKTPATKEEFFRNLADWYLENNQRFLDSQIRVFHKSLRCLSHDINNQLAILTGKTYQIQRYIDTEPLDKEKIILAIEKIENTSSDISKYLQTFRCNSDPDPSKMGDGNLHIVLQDCIDILSQQLTKSKITTSLLADENIIFKRHPNLPLIFLSLIWNSVEAVEGNNEKWIKIEAKEIGKKIQIKFLDSGHCPSKEIQEKIMQPFFSTKSEPGKGLNLYATKKFIEAMNGSFYIDTSLTTTCFVVQLPAIAKKKMAA